MKVKITDIRIGERNRKARKAAEIAQSIKEIGFLNPITVSKDYYLIAGLNRLEAHKLLGLDEIECSVVNLSGIDAQIAEIDENLVRDDLTAWEQGVWLARRKELYLEKYPETKAGVAGAIAKHATAESAAAETKSFVESTAALTNESERTIRQNIQIATDLKEFANDIADLPIADKKTELLDLSRIAKKEPEKAAVIIEKMKSEPEKSLKDIQKEQKTEQRKTDIEQQKKDIEQSNFTHPDGLFDVIAIDPPWAYGREYDPETSRVANPYPEMPQSELLKIELPVKDDAVLFLWTTHAFIFDAKELMDKWGFTYKACMVWNKEKIGMGSWLRMQCEFCLVGIKGKPFWNNTTYRDIITSPRREHSRKPDEFFDMVANITAGRRLEYFSREKRDGWEIFGNDTDKF